MSSIEQLKLEASALRESERVRGKVLKHSDALEQVAKKHGYANWRAAAAILGGETPSAEAPRPAVPPSKESPATIASRLQNGGYESARQSAFTRWLSPKLRQAAVDFSRNIGLVPIYAETSASGTRYLFWQLPQGAKCEVRAHRTKEQFLEFDRANTKQGRRLLSLHISVDDVYSAVWISPENYTVAADFLNRFGITAVERA